MDHPSQLSHDRSNIVVIALDNCIGDLSDNARALQMSAPYVSYGQPHHHDSLAAVLANHTVVQPHHLTTLTSPMVSIHTNSNPSVTKIENPLTDSEDMNLMFFKEIQKLLNRQPLSEGLSENQKKMIKRRSQHFLIIDGNLYYRHTNPKKVVMTKEQQNNILNSMHIEDVTGVHLGVRKMYQAIQNLYYWRGLYIDVATYVRNCNQCMESDVLKPPDDSAVLLESEAENKASEKKYMPTDRATKVWKKVEVQIHGPYTKTENMCEYIVTAVDPFSHWIAGRAIPSDNHALRVANFIFETFCNLGFAQCSLVDLTPDLFENIQAVYKECFDSMQDVFEKLGCRNTQESFIFTLQESPQDYMWVSEILFGLVENQHSNWDTELPNFLFKFHSFPICTENVSPFVLMFGRNPSGLVSEEDKENVNIIQEEEKALEVPTKRRRLQSSILQCRHCYETFTSKISFRIHQRKHTEDAKRRGTLEGEEPLRPVASILEKEKKLLRGRNLRSRNKRMNWRKCDHTSSLSNSAWNEGTRRGKLKAGERAELTENTVAAVKALLAATKEERSKRGKYQKYTPEQRDEIARFALDHGNLEAMRNFTEKLGATVSESTVRNFVKLYKSYTPEMKDEIGKFAYQYGVDSASKHYSAKLGRDVRKGLVRKFKKHFLNKFPEARKQEERSKHKGLIRQKKTYTPELKDEIGKYACVYGINGAIQHFTERLQFAVKESTVRKFKKLYLEKQSGTQSTIQSHLALQPNPTTQSVDIIHTPLSIVNAPANLSSQLNNTLVCEECDVNNSVHYSAIPIHTQGNQLVSMNHGGIAFHQPVINQCAPAYQQSTVIMNQNFNQTGFQQYTFTAPAQHMQGAVPQSGMMLTVNPQYPGAPNTAPGLQTMAIALSPSIATTQPQSILHPQNNNVSSHQVIFRSQRAQTSLTQTLSTSSTYSQAINTTLSFETAGPSLAADSSIRDSDISKDTDPITTVTLNTPRPVVQQLQDDEGEKECEIEQTKSESGMKEKLNETHDKKSYLGQKRGNYASYSPELRAEIGKFAAEKGNQKAMQHFKDILGYEIPESTIRGLKEKYLIKRVRGDKEVTTLGFGPRGRPMRLGKYDEIVQECIKALVKSGEKVSSFLAITTAKQVLMQYEPTMLEENGGPIKLNPTWAKSFLKRIGVHQVL